MTENLTKKPKRGILKQSTSFEQRDLEPPSQLKNPHFDEQNILETLHPADKDYGFMKIDEPKTPYEYANASDDQENESGDKEDLNAHQLAARISQEAAGTTRTRRKSEPSADLEDLKLLSPEERELRVKFEQKRKKHYNEFYAVKMARQLMENDEEDDEAKEDPTKAEEAKVESMEISKG